MMRVSWIYLLCVMIMAAMACERQAANAPHVKPIEQVILISIDTCRADHLGCYGDTRGITPNVDAIAAEATVFERSYSPVPMTLPAHSSMMTGADPVFHGVHDNLRYRLADQHTTLAEIMRERGYVTAGFVSAFVLDQRFGLAQGFDHYDDQFSGAHKVVNILERKADQTTARALDWLEAHHDEPFFLFLHYFDPHDDYQPPQPYATTFADAPYAGEVAFVDDCIGRVIERLKALGLYDDALIIVTADHGEMLGEHGEPTHSYFIYESAVRVPLVIRAPGQTQARRVAEPTGLIDILPTICAFLGVDVPDTVQGIDLSKAVRGAAGDIPPHRMMYLESFTPTKYGCNALRGITDGTVKYILANRQELYDLAGDTAELNNLATHAPARAAGMLDQLAEVVASHGQEAADAEHVLDEQTRRRLESLGYAGGAIEATVALDLDPQRADAKDRLDLHIANGAALEAYHAGDRARARNILEPLLARHPDYLDGYILLADVHRDDGRHAAAVDRLQTALSLDADSPHARIRMALSLIALDRPDEAIAHLRHIVDHQPDFAEMHVVYRNLGDALRQAGQVPEAVDAYRRSLQYDAGDADVHNNLALALRDSGDIQQAIAQFREALLLDDAAFAAHYNLAETLASQGDAAGAATHFGEASRLNPGDVNAMYRFGEALMRLGRDREAVQALSGAARLAPDWPLPLNALAWALATGADVDATAAAAAVAHARRACELTDHRHFSFLDTLAAAYAAAGQYDLAAQTAELALALAREAQAEAQARNITARLALYRDHERYQRPQPQQNGGSP